MARDSCNNIKPNIARASNVSLTAFTSNHRHAARLTQNNVSSHHGLEKQNKPKCSKQWMGVTIGYFWHENHAKTSNRTLHASQLSPDACTSFFKHADWHRTLVLPPWVWRHKTNRKHKTNMGCMSNTRPHAQTSNQTMCARQRLSSCAPFRTTDNTQLTQANGQHAA